MKKEVHSIHLRWGSRACWPYGGLSVPKRKRCGIKKLDKSNGRRGRYYSPTCKRSASEALLSSSPTNEMSEEKTKRLNELLTYLKNMDSTAQLELWKKFIDNHPFDLHQLKALRSTIDERIKLDIISGVPYEVALYILSFLSPKDLCQAAQVCQSWRVVCEDNRLWREKCKEENLLDDEQTLEALFKERISEKHSKQEKLINETLSTTACKSEWRKAYFKHMSILRNWRCRSFVITEPFIAPNPVQAPDQSYVRESAAKRFNQWTRQKQTARRSFGGPGRHIDSTSIYNIANLYRSQNIQPNNQLRSSMVGSEQINSYIISELNTSRRLISDIDSARDDPNYSDPCIEFASCHDLEAQNDPEVYSHLMQLRCHEESVITCLQYNPRTNTIVSGSDDQTLKVWSSETGRCITTLEGHTGGVWSSQLSPDDIVISGSTDRTLKVWKAHTGELMHTLYGHTSTVRCLALNGDNVVSGSRDATLRLWNFKDGVCLHVLIGHTFPVRCVEYKNDIVVSGAYDHLVMVWDAITGTCIHALECHSSRIYSLQFDGRTIASGSLDSTICIWDASTGKLRQHLEGHTSLTSKMQLRGNLLVSGNADSFCKVWDINTGRCLQTLGGESKHTSAITSVYFNNRHVVTSSDDGTVKLWDIRTGKFIRDLIVLPTASKGGVVWRIRASYTKLICAVGSRTQTEDTHLLVLDFNG